MKEIFIDVYKGVFHPCNVLKITKNISNHDETINFFDRVTNEYMVGRLKCINGEYYIGNIKFLNEVLAINQLKNSLSPKQDVSYLPLYLKNIKHKTIHDDDVYVITNHKTHKKHLRKLEFLELKSYEDATIGPIYYYFIINDILLLSDGFDYDLTYSCKSLKPLRKNIIARHETTKSLDDLRMFNGNYEYRYVEGEKLEYNLRDEKILVLKLQELCKKTHGDMDTVLLTKISRMMLASDDRLKAAREYRNYIKTYYDKWDSINKEYHR